ncbi:PPE family protein [Mycobacterium tuberculosis]|nr:PPE family protein [Mycobacterium tuberculosis]KCI69654.1 PPE family protein PPE69 [Mycobacterium tuberculosis TB_RSA95]
MPDPGWAARTPEANDLLLKAGTGVGTHLANQTAWTTLGASHHASGVASAINTAATAASWLGVGSAASALNVTMLNATLHGLAGWVDVKPAVVSTAIAAFETANAAMRPAPECMENRDEWGVDNAINPSVLWTLTPRIVSLDVEYFGVMWPNNAAVGATYGGVLAALAESLAIPPPVATMGASPAAPAQAAAAVGQAAAEAAAGDGILAALAESLAIPPPVATMGASPAAPAQAAAAVGQAAAEAAAGDGMRSAYQGVQAGSTGAGQSTSAGENFGNQLSTFMQPMQAVMQAAPQALQAPSGLMQAPMSAMQPLQSMVGMFANPGALGMGGAAPGASAASAAGGISAAATEVGAGGGGAALGGGGMPATSFTRPVSAFESGTSGRPVGLRPSGALGADVVRAPTTTVGGTPIGGMPVGHAAGGHRGSHGKSEQAATVRVVDDRR